MIPGSENHLDPSRLVALLESKLAADDEQSLVRHLDRCQHCRDALESLAGAPTWWVDTQQCLAAQLPNATNDVVAEDGLDVRLRQQLQHILTPTDDPRMLGRIGNYEIAGVVGRGGTGLVLKAFDGALDRFVAIKVLAPELSITGAARERFKREARAAATVTHENVIPIHAVSESQGHSYIVMQYVPGQSLQQRLQQRGQFEVVEILRIGMQVARALHAAHEQGLVHRDIKPANILLEEGIDRPLVTDFGLARVANDASLTRSGAVAGTPNFMSPEQASGESVDARSDLFSLGSVMYAMCVGHPPFRAETIVGVLRKVCDTEPASMREQNSSIPAWLEAFILKLLAKSREARFPSAAEVAELLSLELAHHQNPTAQRVPPRQWWTGRARQRDRVVHWLWGTGGVASLAGLVVALGTLTAAFTPPATVPSSQAEGHAVVLGSAPSATERITGSSSRDAMAENRDAWQAALEAAVITSQQLEAKWWQPEVSPFYDPWDQEVGEVLKQLQRLESSVP